MKRRNLFLIFRVKIPILHAVNFLGKEEKEFSQKVHKEHYILRSKTIHEYFLRLSSENKKHFIMTLMLSVNNINSITQIIHILASGFAKTAAYAFVE